MSRVVPADDGAITITPAALSQLVIHAAERVDGVRVRLPLPRRRVEVALDGDRARVELSLNVRYGEVLPELARRVQREVSDSLGQMCGLEVEAVDVTVEELDR